MTLSEFKKNVIDPIKLTFDAHVYQRPIEKVIEDEVLRQLNKTNENLIGYFHQNMFRYFGNGWEVPALGVDGWDVENHQLNIFAEFKNKHNTMNANGAKSVHARMRGLVEGNTRAICYLVEVIAKKKAKIYLGQCIMHRFEKIGSKGFAESQLINFMNLLQEKAMDSLNSVPFWGVSLMMS